MIEFPVHVQHTRVYSAAGSGDTIQRFVQFEVGHEFQFSMIRGPDIN